MVVVFLSKGRWHAFIHGFMKNLVLYILVHIKVLENIVLFSYFVFVIHGQVLSGHSDLQ